MPRIARLDSEGLLQHVIVRGIERRRIFGDDTDREWFINRFSMLLTETQTQCLAWSLMTNHFHLLLRPQRVRLGQFMRRLLTGYAVHYNRRHMRAGHLFQNRYKSIVCEKDPYLLELVRYIHLNPLRAGLVKRIDLLDEYRWSGHAVIMGSRTLPGQECDEVLLYFGRRKSPAREKYRQFVLDGVSQGRRPELVGGGKCNTTVSQADSDEEITFDPRVLGSSNFVQQLRHDRRLSSRMEKGLSIAELVRRVARQYDVPVEYLCQPRQSQTVSEARSLVCYCAVRKLRHNGAAVARYLNISRSAVSISAQKGERLFAEKRERVEQILLNITI